MLLILLSQHHRIFDLISFPEATPGISLASALKRSENISHFCAVSHSPILLNKLSISSDGVDPSLHNRKYAKKHYQQERGSQAPKHN